MLVNLWYLLLESVDTSCPPHCWYLYFFCHLKYWNNFYFLCRAVRNIYCVPVICWYMLQLYKHLPYTHYSKLQFESFNSCYSSKSEFSVSIKFLILIFFLILSLGLKTAHLTAQWIYFNSLVISIFKLLVLGSLCKVCKIFVILVAIFLRTRLSMLKCLYLLSG